MSSAAVTHEPALRTVTGRVFDIQRFSIHDGPGIRTTVFLKGCPLRCLWCHNPEGLESAPDISFMPDRCIACGECAKVCPKGGHRIEGGRHVMDRSECILCGACAEACAGGALEWIGRDATVAEVLATVLRDKPFYDNSGGGMTLSGGEPLMQPEFAEALLRAAREEGLNCCVETSGFAAHAVLRRVQPLVDLFFFDVKDTTDASHRRLTGVSNTVILANLRALHDDGARIVLRLPIVPNLNDREDHFQGVAALVKTLPRLEGVEIMPHHPLGNAKWERLGAGEGRGIAESPDRETVAGWAARLAALGVTVMNRSA